MLGVNGATDSKGRVELYEKGYGKDAATIAKEAIAHGMQSTLYVVDLLKYTPFRERQRFRRRSH